MKDKRNYNIFEETTKKLKDLEITKNQVADYFNKKDYSDKISNRIEETIKKKVLNEKKFHNGLSEETLDHIELMLRSLSKVDVDVLSKIKTIFIQKQNNESQTENDDYSNLSIQIEKLDKENEKLRIKVQENEKENILLNNKLEEIQKQNQKLTKEVNISIILKNNLFKVNLEEITKENQDLKDKLKSFKKCQENEANLQEKFNKLTEDYNNLKLTLEEKIKIDSEKYEIEERNQNYFREKYGNHIYGILQYHKIDDITKYLDHKDILKLKLTNKTIFHFCDQNLTTIKRFYESIIQSKDKLIKNSLDNDIKRQYLVESDESERLIKEYIRNSRVVGREIPDLIKKAINFLDSDLKPILGIKTQSGNQTPRSGFSGSSRNATTNDQSLFGGIGNIFSYFGGNQPKPTTGNVMNHTGVETKLIGSNFNATPSKDNLSTKTSGHNSRGMSVVIDNLADLEKTDKFYISESLVLKEVIDFSYSTSDEIKALLNRFLRANVAPDKLTYIIKEIISEYADLLYYVNKAYSEIKELEAVKNIVNERFKFYYKKYNSVVPEIVDLRKNAEILKETKEKLVYENQRLEKDNYENMKDLINCKESQETLKNKVNYLSQKEQRTSVEFISFKTIFTKEIRNLSYDLQQTIKERDEMKKKLEDFKQFFANLGISEKGEIKS